MIASVGVASAAATRSVKPAACDVAEMVTSRPDPAARTAKRPSPAAASATAAAGLWNARNAATRSRSSAASHAAGTRRTRGARLSARFRAFLAPKTLSPAGAAPGAAHVVQATAQRVVWPSVKRVVRTSRTRGSARRSASARLSDARRPRSALCHRTRPPSATESATMARRNATSPPPSCTASDAVAAAATPSARVAPPAAAARASSDSNHGGFVSATS